MIFIQKLRMNHKIPLIFVWLSTWTPSISHRSPTSKGCITNRKMMASKVVLHELPNIKTTRRTWELIRSRNFPVVMPRIRSHMMNIMMPTTKFTMRWRLFTAVLVSSSVRASALRSLKALTCISFNLLPQDADRNIKGMNKLFVQNDLISYHPVFEGRFADSMTLRCSFKEAHGPWSLLFWHKPHQVLHVYGPDIYSSNSFSYDKVTV